MKDNVMGTEKPMTSTNIEKCISITIKHNKKLKLQPITDLLDPTFSIKHPSKDLLDDCIKAYSKSAQKDPTAKRCLLILDLKPFRS